MHETFEKVRTEIYGILMGDDNVKSWEARENMQKAYITFATVSAVHKDDAKIAVRSRWAD